MNKIQYMNFQYKPVCSCCINTPAHWRMITLTLYVLHVLGLTDNPADNPVAAHKLKLQYNNFNLALARALFLSVSLSTKSDNSLQSNMTARGSE